MQILYPRFIVSNIIRYGNRIVASQLSLIPGIPTPKAVENFSHQSRLLLINSYSTLLPKTNLSNFDIFNGLATINFSQVRFKKRGKKGRGAQTRNDDEDDDDDDDEEVKENPLLVDDNLDGIARDYQALTVDSASLRLDSFLRAAMGISRATIEESFYKGNLRINGLRPLKKSDEVRDGDVIDLIRGHNSENHEMIDVTRVIVEKIPDLANAQGRFKIDIMRWSSLTIQPHDRENDSEV